MDSSDYSVLSDEHRRRKEAPGVLECLRDLVRSGAIECFYSGAHLTEMAPVRSAFADAAERRSELLVELCGRNAMVSHLKLFEDEAAAALGKLATVTAVDRNGGWFPEGIAEMSPVTALDHAQSLVSSISELMPNASRAERRRKQRALMKRGMPRPHIKSQILQNAREGSLDEVLSMFPMRPDAARVLFRYSVGDASAEEATAAYESSLRDPIWMMRWFKEHHDKLSPFVAWARGPGGELADKVAGLAERVIEIRANPALTAEQAASVFGTEAWVHWQTELLTTVGSKFADRVIPGSTLTVEEIDSRCPGISTAIRTLHSSWRTITFEHPRKPKPSDFVDSLHAAYAPYVDVFRADGFMAGYVAPLVEKYGTRVVARITEIPEVLARR